jgi:hypothetical protein
MKQFTQNWYFQLMAYYFLSPKLHEVRETISDFWKLSLPSTSININIFMCVLITLRTCTSVKSHFTAIYLAVTKTGERNTPVTLIQCLRRESYSRRSSWCSWLNDFVTSIERCKRDVCNIDKVWNMCVLDMGMKYTFVRLYCGSEHIILICFVMLNLQRVPPLAFPLHCSSHFVINRKFNVLLFLKPFTYREC